MSLSNQPAGNVVLIGCTMMGLAAVRHIAVGRKVILGHYNETTLTKNINALRSEGYDVSGQVVDIKTFDSVESLAKAASESGSIGPIIHTAGIGPDMGTAKEVYEFNLLGTANVIEAFYAVASKGASLVAFGSSAAYMPYPDYAGPSPSLEKHFATAPLSQLLSHPELDFESENAATIGYGITKRANLLRVEGAARAWGRKGARINSLSPGLIDTWMGRQALEESEHKDMIRAMMENSAVGRMGTTEEIAAAVAFLVGPESSFVTGTDLRIDGGVIPYVLWNSDDAA